MNRRTKLIMDLVDIQMEHVNRRIPLSQVDENVESVQNTPNQNFIKTVPVENSDRVCNWVDSLPLGSENQPNEEQELFSLQEQDCNILPSESTVPDGFFDQQTSCPKLSEINSLENRCGAATTSSMDVRGQVEERTTEMSDSSSDSGSDSRSDSSSDSGSDSSSSSEYNMANVNNGNNSSKSSVDDPFSSDDSVKDPNYTSSISSLSEDGEQIHSKILKRIVTNPSHNIEKTTKKRKKNPEMWKKSVAKKLRNSGQKYISKRVIKTNDGKKLNTMVIREAKSILPACGLKCKLKCSEKIQQDQREKIFSNYWKLQNIEKQREFIASSMRTIIPKYKYSNAQRPRKPNNSYSFLIDQKVVRVCKLFFMATLAINHKVISTVLRKLEVCDSGRVVMEDRRGKHGKQYKIDEKIKNEIRNHINSIPRIESHYCRSHSSREYIDGSKTLADLHRDYKKLCNEKNIPSNNIANYQMYSKLFNGEFNLAFHVPKKDQCELCLQYKDSNEMQKLELEEKYAKHIKEKDLSREHKEQDKNSDDRNKVIVFDLQAVLPCPIGDASSFYYVSKLNVLNFTLYDIKSHEGTCFMWHEGEAHRGANEIGTCLLRYLQEIDQQAENIYDVIFYSDNCGGQNKNKFIITLYIYAIASLLKIQTITHKFFITGHSQNEGDSMHALIERGVKKFKKSNPIYSPDQYACIIRNAKKTGMPYKLIELCHTDILDLKGLSASLFINTKKLKLSDVKIFKIDKDHPGIIFYKTSFEQIDYNEEQIIISRKTVDIKKIQVKKVFAEKPGITDAKKKGLLSLIEKKKCVPLYYLDFYKNL